MVFSSDTFLFFFLPACLFGYMLIGSQLRNLWLLLMSLLFYTWGGGAFVLWLLGSISLNYLLGLIAQHAHDDGKVRTTRYAIAGAAIVNMALLGWFKYANFLVEQLTGVHAFFGSELDIDWTNIALPIGISFFTFQALSYVIDVARGDARALKNPLDFALYVSLFPQLIAGPIVRYHEIADQLVTRLLTWDNFFSGALRFSHGLCKKVLIADSAGLIADTIFSTSASGLSFADAWIGLIAYTIQIYFDFSGYSDMAIGLGRMFGFTFPENFKRPYSALSITDFWHRWHITLSTWFRDYLYIPLGGNRFGRRRTLRNLILVFLATGIWHGAAWNFVVWGLFHGFLLVFERLRRPKVSAPSSGFTQVIARTRTLLFVMLGWVLFRVDTLGTAGRFYQAMFFPEHWAISPYLMDVIDLRILVAMVTGTLLFFFSGRQSMGQRLSNEPDTVTVVWQFVLGLIAMPLAVVTIISGSFSPFLYFRF